MELTRFNEKYNKVSGQIYVVEEECRPDNGVYEAELQHDNINEKTLSVYTGRKLTGNKIISYALSTPSLTPWKRVLRIHTFEPVVYVTYETEGDTVEAEDINRVQDAVTATQEAVNREADRAEQAEQVLTENLEAEETRAIAKEKELDSSLKAESVRAKAEESRLTQALSAEQTRAESAESLLKAGLEEEQQRAALRENVIEGSVNSEVIRAQQAEQALSQTINTNKPVWDDKYTRNEVDNKFATLESNIDWKESVNTFANIAAAYPSPQDGWTVNVKDTDYTYRYNGSQWVAISANSIPKATASVDGLLSKEDKVLFNDASAKKHTHSNKSILDAVTQAIVNGWNTAVTHISDAVKHITTAERANWNDAYAKRHEHGNKSVLDSVSQTLLNTWNTVTNKVDKEAGKGLSSNDYTTAEKTKLSSIASGANSYVHPTNSGNKHIPTGGASGQILRWSADGTATWGTDTNITYDIATAASPGLVKSGKDITVDTSGNVSVNDDSHNHVISNVDGLQAALDGKSGAAHTHNYAGSSSAGGAATTSLSCTGNSATATKLQTARTINGVLFDGSANIKINASDQMTQLTTGVIDHVLTPGVYYGLAGHTVTGLPSGVDGFVMKVTRAGDSYAIQELTCIIKLPGKVFYRSIFNVGTNPSYYAWSAYHTPSYPQENTATATKLQTARTINGTNFDGSSNVTTANWGTSRTLTIGNTGKTVNGGSNVSWTLSEIGAASSSHTHNYAGSSSAGGAATTALTCTGNSASATKLQTARTINGTAFNGSANVETAYWGKNRNITIGNLTRSVNGGNDVTWDLEQIGASPKYHASTDTDYGIGTADKYGHVILSDQYTYAVTYGDAANGMAASQMAVADAYSDIRNRIDSLNSNLKWKMYSSLAQLNMGFDTTITRIIDALKGKQPAMAIIAMFKSDFPNVEFASTGQRHVLEVIYPTEGYIIIRDHDISNGVLYFRGHYGENYTEWTSNSNLGWQIKQLTSVETPNISLIPGESKTITVDISAFNFVKTPNAYIAGSRWCTAIILSTTKTNIQIALYGLITSSYAFATIHLFEFS